MQWESLGFKENPFSTDPINQETLTLFTGHQREVSVLESVNNVLCELKRMHQHRKR